MFASYRSIRNYAVFRGKSAFPALSTDYFQTRSADAVSLHFIARYDTRSAARNSRGFICSQRSLECHRQTREITIETRARERATEGGRERADKREKYM